MHHLFPQFVKGRGAVGLLLLRVVTGAAFMFHGWYKIQSPGGAFGWMGTEAPGVLQGLAVLAEFGGGLALILGLLTPLAALGIACTMIVALAMVHLPHGDPFVGQPGKPSFELAAGYLANVILLLLLGPGILSLDGLLFAKRMSEATPGR
jgi:putative oxidoreductase